jgi:hypothetical protein
MNSEFKQYNCGLKVILTLKQYSISFRKIPNLHGRLHGTEVIGQVKQANISRSSPFKNVKRELLKSYEIA